VEAVFENYKSQTCHTFSPTCSFKLLINKKLDGSNIQNLFCHETLHVSGIFCAHHQELSAVRLAIGMFHAGYVAAS
jgi:hypothetical protein